MGSPAFINALLEGVRIHTERQLHQKQQAIEQQRADAQTEAEKARIEQQKEELAQRKTQFEANLAMQKAAHNVAMVQATQALQEGFSKTGLTPPGARINPTNPEAGIGTMTMPGLGLNGADVTMPIQTPQAAAAQAANTYQIANKPIEEAKIRVEAAKQKEIEEAKLAAKREDLDRMNVQKQYDDAREERRQKADLLRTQLEIASRERIARIQRGSMEEDLTPYVHQAINGDITREDINAMPLKNKDDKMRIFNAVIGSGAGLLDKEQKALVGDFSQMVEATKLMDQIIANQPKTGNRLTSHVLGPLARLTDPNLSGPEQQLAGHISLIARGFAKEKGNLSNKDIERVQNMLPSSSEPLDVNIKKRNDYLQELGKLIDSKLSNLPKAQREVIKKKVGLYGIDPPAQGQQAPQQVSPGATHVWTPQGVVPAGGR